MIIIMWFILEIILALAAMFVLLSYYITPMADCMHGSLDMIEEGEYYLAVFLLCVSFVPIVNLHVSKWV